MAAYATAAQLASLSLPAPASVGILSADIDAALEVASRLIDSYMPAQFAPPLVTYAGDITYACTSIAAWHLLLRRGVDPENPSHAGIKLAYDATIEWLKEVRAGKNVPATVVDQTPDILEGAPEVLSGTSRGWDDPSSGCDPFCFEDC